MESRDEKEQRMRNSRAEMRKNEEKWDERWSNEERG